MQQRSLQRTAETFTSAMGATDDTWGRSSSHLEASRLRMLYDVALVTLFKFRWLV